MMVLWLCLPKAGESGLHLLFSLQTTWETKMHVSFWDQGSWISSSSSSATWIYSPNLCCLGKLLWIAPWTLFSLPLQTFPSLSVCPPQLTSCCWISLLSPVPLKQTMYIEVTSPRVLARKGKAHRKKINQLYISHISFICLIFYTHHLVEGGGGGGWLLPSFLLVKCRYMEVNGFLASHHQHKWEVV